MFCGARSVGYGCPPFPCIRMLRSEDSGAFIANLDSVGFDVPRAGYTVTDLLDACQR